MTPLEAYRKALKNPGFIDDPAQSEAARRLDALYHELIVWSPPAERLLDRLRGRKTPVRPVRGLYLWGGVGRGKTFLMDLFFDALPQQKKLRLHFHRFMQLVHEDLRNVGEQQDPMREVARRFAERAQIICLDEMHIKDITDAMIMASLLENLFNRGVCLVTTSNIEPDHLYENGLQRELFLPAIALIKQHTHSLELASPTDYRLRKLKKARIYHHPLNENTARLLEAGYYDAVAVDHQKPRHIIINRRQIPVVRWTEGVVWFDFDVICDIPRSQLDHVDIARSFHTALISNVRIMDDASNDRARRFTTLVDAFYDQQVKLLISAEDAPEKLYRGRDLAFDFERTVSRLKEMQSLNYLAREHLA